MGEVSADDRGRITLPKTVRERYGTRFRVAQLDDGVKLVPVADDPVEGLRDALAGIADVPLEDVEEAAEEEAEQAALEGRD